MNRNFYVLKFIILFIFCFSKTAFAQLSVLDTTYNRLTKISNDSIRKEKLINYIEKLIINKAPHATSLKDEVEKEAFKSKDLAFLGNSYSRFGFSYISIGDYINAFPLYL